MDHDSRIPSLTITQTVPRQTPQNQFGNVLARAAQEVVRTGADLVGGMLPSGAIASAAVSSARAVVSSVASTSVPGTGGVSGAGGSVGSVVGGTAGAATGKGEAWDLLEAQKLMNTEGQKFNMAYLQLQNEMQQESREHNAISNIMKVRHDSAKAAINNIR